MKELASLFLMGLMILSFFAGRDTCEIQSSVVPFHTEMGGTETVTHEDH